VDTAEGPAQESGAASWSIRWLRDPTGFNATCCLLLPPQQIILRAYTLHPLTAATLCSLATLPFSGRRRTEEGPPAPDGSRISFCGYENGTSQLIP
jgi:hypothetical protein